MVVSLADVQHAARLARLKFTGEEAERMRGDLNRILEFMAALDDLDANAEGETIAEAAPLRKDEPATSLPRESVFGNAPDASKGFFVVPNVSRTRQ
jgi:aspartyl-tRNA(Asn)/glutamyl-tRNA(Gln) amidotransferase subunit C